MAKAGRPKSEEKIREEREQFPVCGAHPDCHAWQEGRCIALMDNSFGERDCPFYKNKSRTRKGQQECLKCLVKNGRTNLLEKYKKVLGRLGVFDAADGYMETAAAELERYDGECMKNFLSGNSVPEEGEDEWED